jgi:hypothetical protein
MKMVINGKEFEGEIKVINGKKCFVVKAQGQEIRHPDGRVDVVIKVPCVGAEAIPLQPNKEKE